MSVEHGSMCDLVVVGYSLVSVEHGSMRGLVVVR